MVFIIIRVVAGLKERKGWLAINISYESRVTDVFDNFISGNIALYSTYQLNILQVSVSLASGILAQQNKKIKSKILPPAQLYLLLKDEILVIKLSWPNNGLDSCIAFQFQNDLQKLRKMVRIGKRPLVQIVKRIKELQTYSMQQQSPSTGSKIATKPPNNAYLLSESSCCQDK